MVRETERKTEHKTENKGKEKTRKEHKKIGFRNATKHKKYWTLICHRIIPMNKDGLRYELYIWNFYYF